MKSPLSDFVGFQIQRGDFVFVTVLFVCVFTFVALESIWLLRQLKSHQKKQDQLVWSVIPALILLVLTVVYRSPSPQVLNLKKIEKSEINLK